MKILVKDALQKQTTIELLAERGYVEGVDFVIEINPNAIAEHEAHQLTKVQLELTGYEKMYFNPTKKESKRQERNYQRKSHKYRSKFQQNRI